MSGHTLISTRGNDNLGFRVNSPIERRRISIGDGLSQPGTTLHRIIIAVDTARVCKAPPAGTARLDTPSLASTDYTAPGPARSLPRLGQRREDCSRRSPGPC